MKFGKLKRHERQKLVFVRLPPYSHKTLKVRVAEQGTTLQNWISRVIRRELIQEYLKRKNPPPPVPPEKGKVPLSGKTTPKPENPSKGKPPLSGKPTPKPQATSKAEKGNGK